MRGADQEAKMDELYALVADRGAGVTIDKTTMEVSLSEVDESGASFSRVIGANVVAAVNTLRDEQAKMVDLSSD